MSNHPLIEKATDPAVNRISEFASLAAGINGGWLKDKYREEKNAAPMRGKNGKKYFVDHDGSAGEGKKTARNEEYLAVALFNGVGATSSGLALPSGGAHVEGALRVVGRGDACEQEADEPFGLAVGDAAGAGCLRHSKAV